MRRKTKIVQFGKEYRINFDRYPLKDEFPAEFSLNWKLKDFPILDLHFHNCLEVGYCINGGGIYMIGKGIHHFKGGDLTVIPANVVHFSQSYKGTSSIWSYIFVNPVGLSPAVEDYKILDTSKLISEGFAYFLPGESCPELANVAKEIFLEASEQKKGYKLAIKALVFSFMTKLYRMPVPKSQKEFVEELDSINRILPALEFISKEYKNKISLPGLAKICCMSTRNLCRIFREAIGKSPLDYVQQIRISMASSELKTTNRKIAAIAFDHGFSTLSSFNRQFQKFFRTSPREWKKK